MPRILNVQNTSVLKCDDTLSELTIATATKLFLSVFEVRATHRIQTAA